MMGSEMRAMIKCRHPESRSVAPHFRVPLYVSTNLLALFPAKSACIRRVGSRECLNDKPLPPAEK